MIILEYLVYYGFPIIFVSVILLFLIGSPIILSHERNGKTLKYRPWWFDQYLTMNSSQTEDVVKRAWLDVIKLILLFFAVFGVLLYMKATLIVISLVGSIIIEGWWLSSKRSKGANTSVILFGFACLAAIFFTFSIGFPPKVPAITLSGNNFKIGSTTVGQIMDMGYIVKSDKGTKEYSTTASIKVPQVRQDHYYSLDYYYGNVFALYKNGEMIAEFIPLTQKKDGEELRNCAIQSIRFYPNSDVVIDTMNINNINKRTMFALNNIEGIGSTSRSGENIYYLLIDKRFGVKSQTYFRKYCITINYVQDKRSGEMLDDLDYIEVKCIVPFRPF